MCLSVYVNREGLEQTGTPETKNQGVAVLISRLCVCVVCLMGGEFEPMCGVFVCCD